ncbi:hypothetical protein NNO_0733 [Hydrogenimonas sp.]|nr:hypothetical protein NNO_0733 [Hydrogenimonas sp.]
MSTLNISIKNLRNIKSLEIELPFTKGLYAITGKNASGKSTLMAAIASLFYYDIVKTFFINGADDNSEIKYTYKNINQALKHSANDWKMFGKKIYLHGFYEGSLIHGNRFRDTHYQALISASKVKKDELIPAANFIKHNLGVILHGDKNKYDNLYKLSSDRAKQVFKFRGSPYFLVENEKLISQLSLSTGENLLLSLLHSIYYQIERRKGKEDDYFILLDEVELALHPSALIRLVKFLSQLSKHKNMAIYFSTHSTDLIRNIDPTNIFFLNKHADNSVEVINPCYPAYATRNIYMHDGYDYLILVEDILTKKIVDWVLKKEGLLSSKLVHILPCGGWENVINLHQEIMSSNFLGVGKKAFSVLDGDVEDLFNKKYIKKGLHHNLNVAFLPIQSGEKFLRNKLFDKVDHKFFREFNDLFFHHRPLEDIIQEYGSISDNDKKGKKLLKIIKEELTKQESSFEDITSQIVHYIVENEDMSPLISRIKNVVEKCTA